MFKFKRYGNAKDKVMEEKMRAFVRIGLHLTDEFKDLSEELMSLLREHGRTKAPLESDRSNIHAYMSAVHEGWKNAQNLVLDRLIHNFYELNLLNEDKVKFHKLKDRAQKSECIRLIELIALENLILRRYIDAIVWTVLDCEHSSIRRLPMRGGVDNLNLESLIYIREALLPMNKDPLVIAIASDLTTFIHSGDVIRRRVGGGVEILELKKGKKNIDISKSAKFAVESQCPHFDEVFLSGRSEKDKQHYFRAKKQIKRMADVVNTINTGEGVDGLTGMPLRISQTNTSPEYFSDVVNQCIEALSDDKPWSIQVVENCVYIGAYLAPEMGLVGFNAWMDSMDCKSPIYNLTDTLSDPLAKPFALLDVSTKNLNRILSGEIVVVICFDFKKFFELGNKLYPGFLKLLDSKDKILPEKDFLVDGKLVGFETKDEDVSLRNGTIVRVVFDFQRPSNIVKINYLSVQGDEPKVTDTFSFDVTGI
ncbi:hypothetical protein L5B88_27150 [Pseudomonas aeruginosa]|nr:hypothetical protein [Pseudomonas aeruginosa]